MVKFEELTNKTVAWLGHRPDEKTIHVEFGDMEDDGRTFWVINGAWDGVLYPEEDGSLCLVTQSSDSPPVAEQQVGDYVDSPMGGIQRGDEVLVDNEWYPVVGYALRVEPNQRTTGSVFTLKPYGRFEPCLGYRLNYKDIAGHRRPTAAP